MSLNITLENTILQRKYKFYLLILNMTNFLTKSFVTTSVALLT